jgi:hypothetical protein
MKKFYWIAGVVVIFTAGFGIRRMSVGPNSKDICNNAIINNASCKSNPQELLKSGQGKSSSLDSMKIVRYQTDLMVFKPRSDVPGWNVSHPIQWDADPFNDRNWRMSLNAGRPADNCMKEYETTSKPEFYRCAFDIFKDWHDFHIVQKKSNKFGWYDMSSAYRADRISKLLDWASQNNLLTQDEIKMLIQLAYLHIDYLMNPKNLNPGNHGVFQLASLERLCKVTPYIFACEKAHRWTRDMIEVLTKDQFGPDGLHLEHSPGYHFFMVQVYNNLIQEDVFPLSEESKSLFEKAKSSRPWLISPGGTLPSIGDTDNDSKAELKDDAPDTTFKLFRSGGLGVVRTPESQLWFYAFHHSKTHKHDDDLSFFLWDKGQPLFIDAGKYAYNSDDNRLYILSRKAHNTVIVPGLTLNKTKFYGSGIQDVTKNGNIYQAKGSVEYSNGVKHLRNLEFLPGKSLIIYDKLEGVDKNVEVNFLLAENLKKTSEMAEQVTFKNKKTTLSISTKTAGCKSQTFHGAKDSDNHLRGWFSPSYKEMKPTWAVSFTCPAQKEIITEIKY